MANTVSVVLNMGSIDMILDILNCIIFIQNVFFWGGGLYIFFLGVGVGGWERLCVKKEACIDVVGGHIQYKSYSIYFSGLLYYVSTTL